MKCGSCGCQNDYNAKFCKKCGNKLDIICEHENPNGSPEKTGVKLKSKSTIWCVFVLIIVVLISGFILNQSKHQRDNDLENNNSSEIGNEEHAYSDLSDETPLENNTEEIVITEGTPSQDNTEERVFYRQNIAVEQNVSIIREKYNEIVNCMSKNLYIESKVSDNIIAYYDGNELKAVKVKQGANGIDYAQFYYYDGGDLIFAYYENRDSHRFYFYKEYLMRWRYCEEADKPSNAINYDWENFDGYLDWEFTVLNNSNTFK